jgi:hypothetical protein
MTDTCFDTLVKLEAISMLLPQSSIDSFLAILTFTQVRLVQLALRPTATSAAAAALVLLAAEEALTFCDDNRLRLDFSTLRLTINQHSPSAGENNRRKVSPLIFQDQPQTEVEVRAESEARATGPLVTSSECSESAASQAAAIVEWADGEVNWEGLFTALRSRGAYSENDFTPGAT